MPFFGKSKAKNPPPPPPKPDYTPENADPDENPLYQPPELLQSYLEPPMTNQRLSLRHSASDIHGKGNAALPLSHQLASSGSCSFLQNNLSYEVDGNLVKQIQNSASIANPAQNDRPRSGGSTSYLDSSHAQLQQRLSSGSSSSDKDNNNKQYKLTNNNNVDQSTISVKANDSFIFDGFHARSSQGQIPLHLPSSTQTPSQSKQQPTSPETVRTRALEGNGQIKTASSLHSQLDQLTQLHLQQQQISLPTSSVHAQIQQLQQQQQQHQEQPQSRPTLNTNYSDPKDACKLREMAPPARGALTQSQSFPVQLGSNSKFVMDSSGMFRVGPEGLTVSDPESGVFSTNELENMGCEDDDEYSNPYEPQILRDFLRKVQRDDEIELASASASTVPSNVASPQSPPPAAARFLAASTSAVVAADDEASVYCDPSTAFSHPPNFSKGIGIEEIQDLSKQVSNQFHPSGLKQQQRQYISGFVNPLHPHYSASSLLDASQSIIATISPEQHHFDPRALGIQPKANLEASPQCTCDEGSPSSELSTPAAVSPLASAALSPAVRAASSPAEARRPLVNSNVNSTRSTAPPLPPPPTSSSGLDLSGDISGAESLPDYEQPWDIRLAARDPVAIMSAAIGNLSNNSDNASSVDAIDSNREVFSGVDEKSRGAAPNQTTNKPVPAPRLSVLNNPEVEAIKGEGGAAAAAAAASPLSSRYSTPSGDSQAGNQTYEDPWDSGAKQRELEEKLSKRVTALSNTVERISPSGESETGFATCSSDSNPSALHSPAKFTSAFSSASSAVSGSHHASEVTSPDPRFPSTDSSKQANPRFSPPAPTSHADPFIQAPMIPSAPCGLAMPAVPSAPPESHFGGSKGGTLHRVDTMVSPDSNDTVSYQSPKPNQNSTVVTNLSIFYPNPALHNVGGSSCATKDASANYQTPRIPASRSAQANLTLFTQIPLTPDKTARSTEVVTHAEIHRDNWDSPSRSSPAQPQHLSQQHLNSQNGFSNPLFHHNLFKSTSDKHNINKINRGNSMENITDENSHPGSPTSQRGPLSSPRIPSAPLEEKTSDNELANETDVAESSVKPVRSPRKPPNLSLDLGCRALNAKAELVDQTLPLREQPWFHGSISRTEAERLLSAHQEGSYLVRQSESKKEDYSLSLRSAKGFMHMKIVRQDDKYILGQFSQPYPSIPEMIQHYAKNKLPIKGATHMSLMYPVKEDLL